MESNTFSISILGYNANLNEALADLFPIDCITQSVQLNADNHISNDLKQLIHSSGIIFLELSDVIDTNLGIIGALLLIKSDLKIIGLNEYTQKSYSKHILDLGAKGYIPIHCFPSEFKNALEIVGNGGVYESKFIRKFEV